MVMAPGDERGENEGWRSGEAGRGWGREAWGVGEGGVGDEGDGEAEDGTGGVGKRRMAE